MQGKEKCPGSSIRGGGVERRFIRKGGQNFAGGGRENLLVESRGKGAPIQKRSLWQKNNCSEKGDYWEKGGGLSQNQNVVCMVVGKKNPDPSAKDGIRRLSEKEKKEVRGGSVGIFSTE